MLLGAGGMLILAEEELLPVANILVAGGKLIEGLVPVENMLVAGGMLIELLPICELEAFAESTGIDDRLAKRELEKFKNGGIDELGS